MPTAADDRDLRVHACHIDTHLAHVVAVSSFETEGLPTRACAEEIAR